MKTIINDIAEKELKEEYHINGKNGRNFLVTSYIKNMGDDIEIKKIEIKKVVIFTFEGKERIEPVVLRFKDTNEKGMLYSYEYEFAGRKFAKNYVKEEYKIEKKFVQALQHTDIYKVVEKKTPLYISLKDIWERPLQSIITKDFYFLMDSFDEYLYYEKFASVYEKDNKRRALLADMFVNSLKFDKKKIINYKLNPNEKTFELFTSNTR